MVAYYGPGETVTSSYTLVGEQCTVVEFASFDVSRELVDAGSVADAGVDL